MIKIYVLMMIVVLILDVIPVLLIVMIVTCVRMMIVFQKAVVQTFPLIVIRMIFVQLTRVMLPLDVSTHHVSVMMMISVLLIVVTVMKENVFIPLSNVMMVVSVL
jgi:hypothetical protein